MLYNPNLSKGQKLILPDLANKLGIASPDFLVQDIFQGGMGTCAKIKDANDQVFALKIIHNSLLENELVLQRYIDEMKTWLTLSACNGVVEAICLTKVNQIPCIVAQWMNRGNIRPYISHINPELFYRSIDRIASTLDWAFSNYSIIHRDLKPENILIDSNGNAFVADWGLSRPISTHTNEIINDNSLNIISDRIDITEAGSFIGTILYSSPEQIMGLKSIDHRSDIYSLGCMMYEWETGSPPFIASTPQEIALQHLRNKPKKIGGFFKSTNFKVEKIIEKCLEKNPDRRFQSYSELISAIIQVASSNSTHKKFIVSERYKVPQIGEGEFKSNLIGKKLKAAYSKDGNYAIIEQSDMKPYFLEAEHLMVLGEYKKANIIFEGFYVHDFFKKIADSAFVQYICVNYALSLKYTGEFNKGILVLRTLDDATVKPANYYINLSLLYLHTNENHLAESICLEGLNKYPSDDDLWGNLTIARINQNKLVEAYESATTRISISRNVNSLEEIASVLTKTADSVKNTDFPKAIEKYKTALSYLNEVIELNPKYESSRLSISSILYRLKRYDDSSEVAVQVANTTRDIKSIEIASYYVARNLLWTSEFVECKKFCEKWLITFPNSILLKRILSETLVDGYVIGNIQNGVRIVEKSSLEFFSSIIKDEVNRIPSDFKFLADIHSWMGDAENINYAISILKEGLKIYPDYWKFRFTISAIYHQYNYFDEALQEANKAMQMAPWRESIHFLLASIYKDKGDMINAAKYEQEGLNLKQQKQNLYSQ